MTPGTVVLVIMLWIGDPGDWHEFRFPMKDRAACHAILVAKMKTKHPAKNQVTIIYCDVVRAPEAEGRGE